MRPEIVVVVKHSSTSKILLVVCSMYVGYKLKGYLEKEGK